MHDSHFPHHDSLADSGGCMRGSRFRKRRLKSPIVLHYLEEKPHLRNGKCSNFNQISPQDTCHTQKQYGAGGWRVKLKNSKNLTESVIPGSECTRLSITILCQLSFNDFNQRLTATTLYCNLPHLNVFESGKVKSSLVEK